MIACCCQIRFWSPKPAWNVLQNRTKLKTAGLFFQNLPELSVSPKPRRLDLPLNPLQKTLQSIYNKCGFRLETFWLVLRTM